MPVHTIGLLHLSVFASIVGEQKRRTMRESCVRRVYQSVARVRVRATISQSLVPQHPFVPRTRPLALLTVHLPDRHRCVAHDASTRQASQGEARRSHGHVTFCVLAVRDDLPDGTPLASLHLANIPRVSFQSALLFSPISCRRVSLLFYWDDIYSGANGAGEHCS